MTDTVIRRNQEVRTTISNGIPASYTSQTSSANVFITQKGQLNHYRQRPRILNEHAESSREVQAVVNSTTIVGQIFRASQDNINGMFLTLESAAGITFDDFESYANDAALQAAWVETDPSDPATLETAIVFQGTQSMRLPGDASTNDEWIKTIPATDYTDYTGSIYIYQDFPITTLEMTFFIGDGVNTKSAPMTNPVEDEWFEFVVSEPALVEDGGGTTDTTMITQVGFRLTDRRNNSNVYIDLMTAIPPPGSVNLKLWDMGPSQPVDGVTSIDDGTQYTTLGDIGLQSGTVSEVSVELLGGKREYDVKNFVAGPALEIPGNNLLTVGNYYLFTVNYVDTDVSVYGPNTAFMTDYYQSGYAFTAPNEATAITAIGTFSDLQFGIFSTQEVYINTLIKAYNAAPGDNCRDNVRIEDADMSITGIVSGDTVPSQELIAEFDDRFFKLSKGGKFEVNHSDDFSDEITQASVLIGYLYTPPEVNG